MSATKQPYPDYLPAWVTQQRREHNGSTGGSLASSTFPAFYDWPAPSYANDVQTQPVSLSQGLGFVFSDAVRQIPWNDDSLVGMGMATAAGTAGSSLGASFLDLSDPVSTLWSLNSGNDFMNSQF